MSFEDVLRDPDEESDDIYPNLVVHDGRHSGIITIGKSRLPLNAILWTVFKDNFDETRKHYPTIDYYDLTPSQLIQFMHNLFEARGEFARLVLQIAKVEAVDDSSLDGEHYVHWSDQPDVCNQMIDQLKRCLASIDPTYKYIPPNYEQQVNVF